MYTEHKSKHHNQIPPPMIYKALIFDMDGVIIDSKEQVERFWREKFEQYQIEPEEENVELKYHGRPARHIIDDLFAELPEETRRELAEECAKYDAAAHDHAFIPGVKDLLKQCSKYNLHIGLVTSALIQKVERMLEGLNFDSPFRVIVTAERVKQGKPDPECYLLAARELGIEAEQTIVFEDSLSGVKAASGAGATVIGINEPQYTDILQEAGAEMVLSDFNPVILQNGESAVELLPDQDRPGIVYKIEA
jgi:HAD superfamily hydrolase (TIGR01509 family)